MPSFGAGGTGHETMSDRHTAVFWWLRRSLSVLTLLIVLRLGGIEVNQLTIGALMLVLAVLVMSHQELAIASAVLARGPLHVWHVIREQIAISRPWPQCERRRLQIHTSDTAESQEKGERLLSLRSKVEARVFGSTTGVASDVH